MASGIYIKPSKRGTFTAAAKSHGKSVQGFASQVLANKDNYSPAMVKKANFARNAAGWNKETGGILPIYGCGGSMKKEMGGELMMLDQYGFGSWLKENGAGLLKGAGSLVSMIPGIGQIAGPVLSTAGSVIGGIQEKNAQQDAAQAEADAMAAAQAEQQRVQDLETRRTNVVDQKQISYAPTFGFGGNLQLNNYMNGNTHDEGVGGIPVDARGNPATTSKSSAVGLTEKGEVTWNGYVFSDKIKIS